jgi:hypothetical protein
MVKSKKQNPRVGTAIRGLLRKAASLPAIKGERLLNISNARPITKRAAQTDCRTGCSQMYQQGGGARNHFKLIKRH